MQRSSHRGIAQTHTSGGA